MAIMGPSEWNEVVDIFHAALEKSDDQRAMLLDRACGTQTLLRKAVEGMLQEYESADGFLSKPLLDPPARESFPGGVRPKQRFERFIILEMLGRGGIGEVWSARDTQLDRSVALKFLRAETTSEVDKRADCSRGKGRISFEPSEYRDHSRSGSPRMLFGHCHGARVRQLAREVQRHFTSGRGNSVDWRAGSESAGGGSLKWHRSRRHQAREHHAAR